SKIRRPSGPSPLSRRHITMFESAELGNKIDKDVYRREAPQLRADLLQAQKRLADSDLSVVIVVSGMEGAGKAETVNLLLKWLDARGLQTHSFGEPTDEERERPPLWRFWRVLPPRGRMAVLFGAWDVDLLLDCALGHSTREELDRSLERD